MIGDALRTFPTCSEEVAEIFSDFDLYRPTNEKEAIYNAIRLIELNNEVYTQLHSRSFIQEKFSNIIDAEKQELLEQMNNVRK